MRKINRTILNACGRVSGPGKLVDLGGAAGTVLASTVMTQSATLSGSDRTERARALRLAYVTVYDSADVKQWSGTGFHIAKSLEDQGCELVRIGGLKRQLNPVNILRYLWNTRVRGLRDHPHRDPGYLRHYARQVQRGLARARQSGPPIDAILVPGILPIAYLETDIPIIVWTDCTFASLLNYYAAWTNLSPRTIRDGHEADRRGLNRARTLIFTSQWAADSAVRDYGCDPDRIHIVPLGANIEGGRSEGDILRLVDGRLAREEVRLLLAGVNWERKGCDIAVRVLAELRSRGIAASLDIVGCHPPDGVRLPDGVRTHGFISKSSAEGRASIQRFFEQASLFVLPTRAECLGIVFGEAASYGLPSLATDTGGIASVARDGVTGFLLAPGTDPALWADRIASLMRNPAEYRRMSLAALREYDDRLNWPAAGRAVAQIVRDSRRMR